MANDRDGRTGTRSLVLLVSLIAATACTGVTGNESSVSISASPTVAPAPPTMHDGPIGVYGALNGVRALTRVRPRKGASYRCRTCTDDHRGRLVPGRHAPGHHGEDGLYVVDVAGRRDRLVVPSSADR